MDITRSMESWKNECMEALNKTIEYINSNYKNCGFRLGFLGYRDRKDEVMYEKLEFTTID